MIPRARLREPLSSGAPPFAKVFRRRFKESQRFDGPTTVPIPPRSRHELVPSRSRS